MTMGICKNCGTDIEYDESARVMTWIHIHNNSPFCSEPLCAEPILS